MNSNKRKRLKTFVVVSAVLATLILCFAGCQVTIAPTASPTTVPTVIPTATTLPSALPASSEGILYTNTQYGFTFALPASWKGYKIIEEKWQGNPAGSSEVTYTGPEILIRNPAWTEKVPTQDIPIMIFTISQWNDLQQEKFHIGAAPIGPSELGRNSKYVFALPARYNYAFPKGYEEVESILAGKPLKPIE